MNRPGKTTRKTIDFSTLTGVWRSRGYGNLLEIGPEVYTLYEETNISCLPVFQGSLEELAEHYVDLEVSPRGRAFSAKRAAGVTRLSFRRLKALPSHCGAVASKDPYDPVNNFDILWHHFAEHYALFDLRGVDWPGAYEQYRSKINSTTSPQRLFEIFTEMLRPLRDGHVQLHTTCGHYSAGAAPRLYDRLAQELEEAEDARDVPSYLAELREWLRETIHEEYLHNHSRTSCNRLLEWGRLNEATGYLAIRAMAGLSGRTGQPREDFVALDAALTRCMNELGSLPMLVIDLRGNGGGYDGVALRIAGYLVDRKRLAFYKAARHGAAYTGKQPVYVVPQGPVRFAGRLVVLTSELTASAAEVFVLALLQHPRLTLMGEATHGILSDAMERHLPNGWFLTLSNELYSASDGELYEDCGIPPHIEIPFLDRRGRESGRDPMLDYSMNISRHEGAL